MVDAKVPLDACLDATSTDDEAERAHHLRRHVAQVRSHVEALGSKQYWRSLTESPEFVVLFVPAESFLAAALETDGSLIEHAAARQVVLASPTTLIALLRTVAHGWSHEALAEQAQEIHRLGRELHGRLSSMNAHLDQLGRSLNAAVGHYNQTVGSLESRVLVTARRFGDLPVPRQVEAQTRSVPPAEGSSSRSSTGAAPTARRARTIPWHREPAPDSLGGGREPGRQVVALGVALALTAVVLDLALSGSVGLLFDVVFVLGCVAMALAVRPSDFFHRRRAATAAHDRDLRPGRHHPPDAIADAGDGVVQAVVSGLSHHAGALVAGYLLALGVLAVRHRVIGRHRVAH